MGEKDGAVSTGKIQADKAGESFISPMVSERGKLRPRETKGAQEVTFGGTL